MNKKRKQDATPQAEHVGTIGSYFKEQQILRNLPWQLSKLINVKPSRISILDIAEMSCIIKLAIFGTFIL